MHVLTESLGKKTKKENYSAEDDKETVGRQGAYQRDRVVTGQRRKTLWTGATFSS